MDRLQQQKTNESNTYLKSTVYCTAVITVLSPLIVVILNMYTLEYPFNLDALLALVFDVVKQIILMFVSAIL